MKSRSLFISLGLIGALAACQSNTEAPAPAEKADAAAEPAKADAVDVKAEALPTKADPACVGAAGEGAPQMIETANGKWERNGSTVTWKDGANAEGIVLGALTDIKDGAAENIANLKKAVTFFTAEKVDAIVVAVTAVKHQSTLLRFSMYWQSLRFLYSSSLVTVKAKQSSTRL